MKALTLTQPWAGLVASGIKLIENRSRPMINVADFGKPFAIHASRELDIPVYRRILELAPELGAGLRWYEGAIRGKRHIDLLPDDAEGPLWYRLSRITSAVIGVASIDKCFTGWDEHSIGKYVNDCCWSDGRLLGPDQTRWFFGPVAYALRDVRALEMPIACPGQRGFWQLPADVERRTRMRRCDYRYEHDEVRDVPMGARCVAAATHRISWEDGRYSFACRDHLEIDNKATVRPTVIEALELVS